MKSKAGKTKDNAKYKEWEKQRRDRLNDAFKALAQLLPNYDPAKDPPKIDVLEKSTQFIKELRLSNSRLLTQQTQETEQIKKIRELQDEVNKLILRVKQLTLLLNQAKIPIPIGPFIKVLGKKRLKWTNQLSEDDLENSKQVSADETQCTDNLPNAKKDLTVTDDGDGNATNSTSPLKEANSGEVNKNQPVPDRAEPPGVNNTNLDAIVEVSTPQICKSNPLVKNKKPKAHTSHLKQKVAPQLSMRTSRSINSLIQPTATTTLPNLSFPVQTTYILTRCPVVQPQTITQFTISPSPRIILSKPPLSSSGDAPKIAIPPLRRPATAIPISPVKLKRRRMEEVKSAAKSKSCHTQTDKALPVQIQSIVNVKDASKLEDDTEPEPILVDISGAEETEILPSNEAKKSPVIPVTEIISISRVSTSDQAISLASQDPLWKETVREISEAELCTSDHQIEKSNSTAFSKVTANDSSPKTSIEPKHISGVGKSNIQNCDECDKEGERREPSPSAKLSENVTEGQMQVLEQSINTSNVEVDPVPANGNDSNPLKSTEEVGKPITDNQSQPDQQSCSHTDKISECIARSIDLIDHPETELMELSGEWGSVVVGHSPKSPISPTQMFLSMFPLLPRESIITAGGVEDTSIQQSLNAHSSSKNVSSQFCPNSRSSFYIDSMLPSHVNPQLSGIEMPPNEESTMESSICLAMTPLSATQSCVQQTLNIYSSPPSFQPLINTVPSSCNVPNSRISTLTKALQKAKSTATSSHAQVLQEETHISKAPNYSRGNLSSTSQSSIFDQIPARGTPKNKKNAVSNHQVCSMETFGHRSQPHQATNSVSHTISQMFNSFVNSPSSLPVTHSVNESFYCVQDGNAVCYNNANDPSVSGNASMHRYSSSELLPNINNPNYQNGNRASQDNLGPSTNLFQHTGDRSLSSQVKNSQHRETQKSNIPDVTVLPANRERIPLLSSHSNIFLNSAQSVGNQPNFNCAESRQEVERETRHVPRHYENKNTSPRSFPRVSTIANGAQHTVQTTSNPLLNSDFPVYSAQSAAVQSNTQGQGYQIQQQTSSHFPYIQTQPAVPVTVTPTSAPTTKSTFKIATQPPMQNPSSSKSRRTSFYIPDHFPKATQSYDAASSGAGSLSNYSSQNDAANNSLPKQSHLLGHHCQSQAQSTMAPPAVKSRRPLFYLAESLPQAIPLPQYDSCSSLTNYSNQHSSRTQFHQPELPHYSNNFTPHFHTNSSDNATGGVGHTANAKQPNSTIERPVMGNFYHDHSIHHQLASEAAVHLNMKNKPTSTNFLNNNAQNSSVRRTNSSQSQPSQSVARPVNWMTDPPPKKATSRATNPFSVSKLVGNQSNNYCTEALISKNTNSDWSDFHCYPPAHPEPPNIPSSIASTNSGQVYPSHQSQDDYSSHSYVAHSNFDFNHQNPQQHYNQMNLQSQTQAHGTSQTHCTNTSVSNFNLSSIFPEINDKRGNNSGYYPNPNNNSGK